MAYDAVYFMTNFISQIWRLFTSWEFPWLGFSPAQFFFFILLFRISVRLVKSFLVLDHTFFGRALQDKFRENNER